MFWWAALAFWPTCMWRLLDDRHWLTSYYQVICPLIRNWIFSLLFIAIKKHFQVHRLCVSVLQLCILKETSYRLKKWNLDKLAWMISIRKVYKYYTTHLWGFSRQERKEKQRKGNDNNIILVWQTKRCNARLMTNGLQTEYCTITRQGFPYLHWCIALKPFTGFNDTLDYHKLYIVP